MNWKVEYYWVLIDHNHLDTAKRWIQIHSAATLEEALRTVTEWRVEDAAAGMHYAYRVSNGDRSIIL